MLDVLQRRRWLAMGTGVVVLLVAALIALALPSEYRAESVMQIEPHHIPADFFPTSVTSFEERMRTLKHGVLARPVLERVLEETQFYDDWKADPDEAIARLRRNTEVRLEGEVSGGPPSLLFVVEVRGRDREKVARAADLIPRAYAELTRNVMQTQAQNLQDVLARQLDDLGKRLSTEEQKLVAFKAQHALEMPDANDANQRAASTLVAQIDMRLGHIADAQRRRTALIGLIPEAFSDAGLAGGNAEDVLRRLETARAQYGDDHPEVKRLQRQHQEVSTRSADQLKRFRRDRFDAQIAALDREIQENQGVVKQLQGDLAVVQKRLDAAPRWAEQYRVLSREWETLRGKYTSTLSRASDAAAARALLVADAPNLFRVVQTAVAPSRPAGPNRINLLLIGLAVAIGAALLVTAAAEYFDSSLRGPQDATAFGVPVLASIPRIGARRSSG
jgi:uncharacterized protein involved in exopolysaccharide biosynthesis